MSDTTINAEEMVIPAESPYGQASPIISVKNHIYLYADIDTTITRALFQALHEQAIATIAVASENNAPIVPIYLHINSNGGNCSDALAIVQCIKDIQNGTIHKIGDYGIKIPIYTVIEGEADSAASLIACVGSKRFCSKYALSLVHDPREIFGNGGKIEDIQIEAKNLQMFKDQFYNIYLEHSKLTKEELQKICEKEDYSTPEELLKYGLIDEIVD